MIYKSQQDTYIAITKISKSKSKSVPIKVKYKIIRDGATYARATTIQQATRCLWWLIKIAEVTGESQEFEIKPI